MRTGPTFPRGEWSTSPLRLLEGDHVQAQLRDGTWIAGTLRVFAGGLEIEYDEPRAVEGCVESSRLLDRAAVAQLRMLLRPRTLWTDEVRVKRDGQIWEAGHPAWGTRLRRWSRELFHRDPVSAEPVLRRYLGRRILVEMPRKHHSMFASGLLLAFDAHFVALADCVLPAETSIPLSPGRVCSGSLDILWNDDGLELLHRGGGTVEILGLRTAEGMRPWEIVLRPGFRERIGFRRAPTGTAELVLETPERGDAVLPRDGICVRGGSEGSVAIPALPDPSTLLRDLPIGTTPESREEPPVPVESEVE
jgi:hypothetical protein